MEELSADQKNSIPITCQFKLLIEVSNSLIKLLLPRYNLKREKKEK
jgi:hypothetical protein